MTIQGDQTMAVGKTPPSITKQLLRATRQQASAFSSSKSEGGKTITWPEMNAMLSAYEADPATVRAADGGPVHFSDEAKEGLIKLLGSKKMDRGARVDFLRAVGAWPEYDPGDEIVAMYAVALRRAADAVRADPTNPEKLAVARMMSTVAADVLKPVAAVATTPLRGSGIRGVTPQRGRALASASSTNDARAAFRATAESNDGLNDSIEALKALNAAIRG